MTYFLADRCVTHFSQQLEAGKLVWTMCGRRCMKAGQGDTSPSVLESESAQAPFGIKNAESKDDLCKDTPFSSKRANVMGFIYKATGCRSWSRRAKRYSRNIVFPIVLDELTREASRDCHPDAPIPGWPVTRNADPFRPLFCWILSRIASYASIYSLWIRRVLSGDKFCGRSKSVRSTTA